MHRRSFLAMTAFGAICSFAISIARADEVVKFRMFLHSTSAQVQEVGDVEGHLLNVSRFSGFVSFSDGAVGTGTLTATTDTIKGAGTFHAYFGVTPTKGSTVWVKVDGTAKPSGNTGVFPEAAATVVGGSGKFEGAKGDGTFVGGVRMAVLPASGAGVELWNDLVINLKN